MQNSARYGSVQPALVAMQLFPLLWWSNVTRSRAFQSGLALECHPGRGRGHQEKHWFALSGPHPWHCRKNMHQQTDIGHPHREKATGVREITQLLPQADLLSRCTSGSRAQQQQQLILHTRMSRTRAKRAISWVPLQAAEIELQPPRVGPSMVGKASPGGFHSSRMPLPSAS